MIRTSRIMSREERLRWVSPFRDMGAMSLADVFTGFVNSSLYTGSIDYQSLATTPNYWLLSISCMFMFVKC